MLAKQSVSLHPREAEVLLLVEYSVAEFVALLADLEEVLEECLLIAVHYDQNYGQQVQQVSAEEVVVLVSVDSKVDVLPVQHYQSLKSCSKDFIKRG